MQKDRGDEDGRPPPKRAPDRWVGVLRRHAVTAALVALVVVLGVVLLWDQGNVSTGETERRKHNLLGAWRADDVTEVRLTAKGRTGTLVRRPDDAGDASWSVELDGRRQPADEQAVADYLQRLEFAQVEARVAPSSVDRAAFKLDAPEVSVAVTMGRLRYDITIGGPTADGKVYAEVAGVGVSKITTQLATALDLSPDSFRSRSLLPYVSTDFAALTLEGEGGPRSFERAPWSGGRGAGFRWAPGTAHAGMRADARAIDKVLVAFGQLQATQFLSEPPAVAARVTVTVRPKAGPPAVLTIGGACPGREDDVVVVRREPEPVAACAAAPALAALSAPAEAFVDRRAVGAELDEITEVKLVEGQNKVELARAGAGWHVRAPGDRDLEPEIGRAFVESLLAVTGARFADASEAAAASPPRATARIVSPVGLGAADAGADRIETIEVGAEGKELTPVRRLEDGLVLMVPNAAARALAPRDLALRGQKVWSENARRIRSLRVESGKLTQRVERGSDGWTLLEPTGKGLRADTGLCNDLAATVAGLGAERWVAERAEDAHGLDRPRMVVEAELEEGADGDGGKPARRLRLEIGAPTDGGAFARTGDEPAVFVAPRAIEASAGKLLVDRESLNVSASQLRKMSVSRADGSRLVALREGDAWKLTEPARDPDAAAKVAALVAAVGDLSAEAAVAVGPPEKHHGLDAPRLVLVLEGSAAGSGPVRITVGAADSLRGLAVYYARREGVDATFAVAQSKLRELEEAW